MYLDSHDSCMMKYLAFSWHKYLMVYASPFLLCIGITGNVLSFAILMRKNMRQTSTYNYLAVLSVADTLVISSGLLIYWIRSITGFSLNNYSEVTCRLGAFIGYLCSHYSVWLIIAVTVERYVAVFYPLKVAIICSQSNTAKFMLIILLVLVGIDLQALWTNRIYLLPPSTNSSANVSKPCPHPDLTQVCDIDNSTEVMKIWTKGVWPVIDALLYSFLPFGVILILNAMIIRRVMKAKKERRIMSTNTLMCSTRGSGSNNKSGRLSRGGAKDMPSTKKSDSHQESGRSLTVMLLSLSFMFLIMTLPTTVFYIVDLAFASQIYGKSDEHKATATLLRTISSLLMFVNHSVNFFLYCATGRKFRNEIKAFAKCSPRK